ncbi:hypothetical protein KKG46_02010, partial [Patescibacteria group bacterium]|nr:hypothetical protein [Patescibacteria group bacterium]
DKKPVSGPLYTIAKETQQNITDAPAWDKGWSWPNAAINPRSVFYVVSVVREWIGEHKALKAEDKYDQLLWLASKRLEEINVYDLDTLTVESNLDKYDQKISALISALNSVKKEKRDKNYWGFVQKMVAYTRRGYKTLSEKDLKVDLVYLDRVKESYMNVWDWARKNADYGCADYCYKLDVIADNEYTIYVNDIKAREIDIDQLGIFPLQVAENGKWVYTNPIKLKKQQYSSKLVYEGEKNLVDGQNWAKFNGAVDALDAKTPEWIFGTTVTDLTLGKEKLHIIDTSDAYYYLSIDPWEVGTKYRVSFDYNTGRGTLRTLVMYQPEISAESDWNADENLQVQQYTIQFSNELSYTGDSNLDCDYKEEGVCFARTEFFFTPKLIGKDAKLVITGTSSNELTLFYPIGIRNLKITKVKPATIVAYSAFNTQPAPLEASPNSVVEYKKINPTKYLVKIVNPTKNSYLVLNENFGAWKVYLPGSVNLSKPLPKQLETLFLPSVPESNHFTLNGFANAWKLEADQPESAKELNLIMEYFPQKVFYISVLISFLATLALLTFAGINNLWKVINERKKND